MSFRWAAALAMALPALHAQSACNNTPAYSTCEMAFDLSDADAAAHPNPYATVDLRVEFRSPARHTYALPAYWDGGRRLVVRFAPTEAGQWDYLVSSNLPGWEGKTGSFTAAESASKGFLLAANVHHWRYTEKSKDGLYQPHLWMGANEPLFATMDDAAFRATADGRAAEKFTHVRGFVLAGSFGGQFDSNGLPNLDYFRRLDTRVRYLNEKGLAADLVLAGGAGTLTRLLPTPEARRRFMRFAAGRYAAFNVTWGGVDRFDDYPGGRGLLAELGGLLKEFDPYNHPRTTGTRVTSSPLLDDKWQTFVGHATTSSDVNAIEHQLYPVPFVNIAAGAGATADPAAFRRDLWNALMDGQYVSVTAANAANARAAQAMADFLAGTRYWELEPYFDVDGGRALALEDTEYVVYVEKPGPIELTVEKHGYNVFWMNPATGEITEEKKKFSGGHFTGEPPDRAHDWVLHVVREGHLEGMNRSYKFESERGAVVMQEVEANTPKVPFAIEQPAGDISKSKPAPYAAKLTRETRATRSMYWLWVGDVAADHQGFRVLGTGQKGQLTIPADLANHYPAVLHLRLYGMNSLGKVYELDTGLGVNP
ncbi:MAG TPA: DUF5060 domain-containing protein [Bryobacteraceae bacterium]|nr:DUF5060 domain-containing protein [Bryobacteraceae bacterium]